MVRGGYPASMMEGPGYGGVDPSWAYSQSVPRGGSYMKDGTRRGDPRYSFAAYGHNDEPYVAEYTGEYGGRGSGPGYDGRGPSAQMPGVHASSYGGYADYGGQDYDLEFESYGGRGAGRPGGRGARGGKGGEPGGSPGLGGTSGKGGAGSVGGASKGGLGNDDETRFPRIAQKLNTLKSSLPDKASKVYAALQAALQPHSRPHGSRPNFEKDFHASLALQFPDAWDISTRQIGNWNQWEITIDGGRPIYCSVRLEVLHDDSKEFVRELKSKARVVKETLLENSAQWKRTLQPERGSFNFDKLSQFEQECATRVRSMTHTTSSGSTRYSQMWVESKDVCKLCGKHTDEDQLNGQHVCVVFAKFQCTQCDYSWNSYHARYRQETQALIGQKCSRCNVNGEGVEWRVVSAKDRDPAGGGQRGGDRRGGGMHQSELCDACLEYGNCMGVFYDPFILTTALSLVSGTNVQWRAFSDAMPELLIADLGPNFRNIQICLQPHVYVSPTDSQAEPQENARGGGRRFRVHTQHQEAPEGSAGSKASRVKNAGLLAGFLAGTSASSGNPPDLSQGASSGIRRDFLDDLPPASVASQASSASVPVSSLPKSSGDNTKKGARGGGDEAGGPHGESNEDPGSVGAEDDARKVNNKFNKIGKVTGTQAADSTGLGSGGSAGAAQAAQASESPQAAPPPPSTPLLDTLPPLRRAQFLQVVLRRVKACGSPESDKFSLSEEYLARFKGDYDQAYQYVKSLASPSDKQ